MCGRALAVPTNRSGRLTVCGNCARFRDEAQTKDVLVMSVSGRGLLAYCASRLVQPAAIWRTAVVAARSFALGTELSGGRRLFTGICVRCFDLYQLLSPTSFHLAVWFFKVLNQSAMPHAVE
jgi:hypothetical protein